MGKKGVYKKISNILFEGTIKVEGNPRAEDIEESLKLKCPKVPLHILLQMGSFFRFCRHKKDSEGYLGLALRKNQWHLICPEQWNSLSGVHYHLDAHPEECEGMVADAHCHPGSSAGHSGTDTCDEKGKSGFFIVMGEPYEIFDTEIVIVANVAGKSFKLKSSYIFDTSTIAGPTVHPKEWEERVKKRPCTLCPEEKKWGNWDSQHVPGMSMGMDGMHDWDGGYRHGPDGKTTEAWWECPNCKQIDNKVQCTRCGHDIDILPLSIMKNAPWCTVCNTQFTKIRCGRCKSHYGIKRVLNEISTTTADKPAAEAAKPEEKADSGGA